jgi:CheY-like chemotaxis protein
MTAQTAAALDQPSGLADVPVLPRVRILEVTGPADGPHGVARAGASSREQLIGSLLALAPGGTSVELYTVHGSGAALQQLRVESYDLLLVHHAPPALDAAELLRALRSADATEAVVVTTSVAEEQFARECFVLGADTLSFQADAGSCMARVMWRAAQRAEMARHLQRLDAQRRRRVQREATESCLHQEALVQILRGLDANRMGDLPKPAPAGDPDDASSGQLQDQYFQLLRLYVVMGAGNLSEEVSHWSLLLAGAGITTPEFFRLHLRCVAQLKQALGNRGSRHCDRRADLLLIELLAHLARHHEQAARGEESNEHSPTPVHIRSQPPSRGMVS